MSSEVKRYEQPTASKQLNARSPLRNDVVRRPIKWVVGSGGGIRLARVR